MDNFGWMKVIQTTEKLICEIFNLFQSQVVLTFNHFFHIWICKLQDQIYLIKYFPVNWLYYVYDFNNVRVFESFKQNYLSKDPFCIHLILKDAFHSFDSNFSISWFLNSFNYCPKSTLAESPENHIVITYFPIVKL